MVFFKIPQLPSESLEQNSASIVVASGHTVRKEVEGPVVESEVGRPVEAALRGPDLDSGVVPQPGDLRSNGEVAVLRGAEGEDLKCELFDSEGRRVTVRPRRAFKWPEG